MDTTVMGIATALNVIVVIWKLRHGRVIDGIVDGTLLTLVTYVFMGSASGLQMGTIGSALVSVYLIFDPIKVDLVTPLYKAVNTIAYVITIPFITLWRAATWPFVKIQRLTTNFLSRFRLRKINITVIGPI